MENVNCFKGLAKGVELLKEYLHAELLSHFDLCVIFLLLLRGELDIYERRSARTLLSMLVRRWPGISSESCNNRDVADEFDRLQDAARKVNWDVFTKRVLLRIRKRLGMSKKDYSQTERKQSLCSSSDYAYCSSCLGKEAAGMLYLLRRCVCKSRKSDNDNFPTSPVTTSADYSASINDNVSLANANLIPSILASERDDTSVRDGNSAGSTKTETNLPQGINHRLNRLVCVAKDAISQSNHNNLANFDYGTSCCGKCTKDPDSARIVAVISPFVVKDEVRFSKGSRRSAKRKIRAISGGDSSGLDYSHNMELYISHHFPLHSYLQGVTGRVWMDLDGSFCDPEKSNNIADSLFDIVETVLLPAQSDETKPPSEACVLALILSSRVLRDYNGKHKSSFSNGTVTDGVARALNTDVDDGTDQANKESSGTFSKEVELMLIKDYEAALSKISRLMPFPTTYWLIDPQLVEQVSTLESLGAISRLEQVIDDAVMAYEVDGSSADFVEQLIKDNLAYICSRLELVHPYIMTAFYNLMVNSTHFYRYYGGEGSRNSYISLTTTKERATTASSGKNQVEITKAMVIANTIRTYGIGGSHSFVHIKCLHTNLAFALAEGSTVGNVVFRALNQYTD
ncbi:hypothetical protein BaOVIS_005570 [Babesia ovis]|uniref:Uncharacterized protein n=1 Tax=Babesia ovis TaxID=5869 RepID=A0A9W5T8J3_BABOV|nr:hypothetical protein BaOVIS_005570 [Babesia ovis]